MSKCITTILLILLYAAASEGCGRKPNKPPLIFCPKVSSEVVDAGQTSKYMSWPHPVWDDDRDRDLEVILESGSGPNQFFSEGFHVTRYMVSDKDGWTSFCSVYFTIIVPRCKPLALPTHGSISCDIGDNIYGRRCTFSCDDGYWLDGASSSFCQDNGIDTHTTPVCQKIQCGDLAMPAFSVRYECTDTNYFGSVCVLFCNTTKGYSPLGHNFATCIANRDWNYNNWECVDSEKPKFSNCIQGEMKTSVINFIWPTITATDNSGSVNMTQTQGPRPGSRFTASHLIQYGAVDPTGNEAPPCVFTVTYEAPECQPPKPAAKDTDPKFQCLNHKVGSSCQASCLTRVIGSRYIQCRQTGAVIPTSEWFPTDGDFPTCFKKSCAALPPPTNGALVCDKFHGGTMCQIHCNSGYDVPQDLSHLSTYICVKDNWTPKIDPPQCTELQFPDFYNLRSRSYYYTGDCNESSIAIRKSFIENLKKVADFLCPKATCTVENVQVKCGKVKDGDPWDNWGNSRKRSVEVLIQPNDDPSVSINSPKRALTAPPLTTSTTPPVTVVITSAPDTGSPSTNVTTGIPNTNPSVTSTGIPNTVSTPTIATTTTAAPKTHQTGIQFNFVVKNSTKGLSDIEVVSLLTQVISNTTVEVGGVALNFNKTLSDDVTFSCGPGKTVSNSSASKCVACSPGTFHNQTSDKCEVCPLNFFSDKPGQTVCKSCKQFSGTLKTGSSKRQDCLAKCTPGHYSESGFHPCLPCQLGYYQTEHFKTSCKQCPSDTTTKLLGTSSLRQCIKYDLGARGPVQLNFGSVINDWVEELTVALWINILPPLDNMVNISLTFSHPTRGHQLTWYFKDNTDLSMRDDEVNVQTSVKHSIWTHMALVWKGYPSFVDMFVGGKRIQHYGGHTPLCFLPKGTELSIHLGNNSGAKMKGVYVIPRSNTSDLIASMAKACSAADTSLRSLVPYIKPSNPSLISTVVPSDCSEINRCDPSPCPGHHCKSMPHDYECVCKGGYSGKDCSIPPDFCAVDNKCENGGTCSNTNTSIKCTCTDDFKGQYCETAIIHGNWGPWSSWSSCSLTCGGGQRSRTRLCNNPAPEPIHGRPCPGNSSATSKCNPAKCPECRESQLLLGKGTNASCVKAADGSMTCSVSCAEGLAYPGPDTTYNCKDENWTPSKKTLSCVEVNLPEEVGLKYTIPYNTSSSNSQADKAAINRKVSQCVSTTPCARDQNCTYGISVEVCTPGGDTCGDLDTGFKATVWFIIRYLPTDREVKAAWNALNETRKDLERRHMQCFAVDLSPGPVNPGPPATTNTMTCQEGNAPDKGYCSACEAGTHYVNQTCVTCAKGWYQENTGQSTCNMCPAAFNTAFRASTLPSECQAPSSDASMLLVDPKQGRVLSANMSTFILEEVHLPTAHAEAVTYDVQNGQYFYADRVRPGIRAFESNQTATLVELSYSSSISDMAVDVNAQMIFYTDKGSDVIGVVTILQKYHKKVIKSGANRPKHIVLDPQNGILYWIDWGKDKLIERALYDGTERRVLFRSRNKWPLDLVLDASEQKLYWTEGSGKSLQVMDVDGSNRRTVLTSVRYIPFSLTTFNGYIFYSSSTQTDTVMMRVNPDGSGIGQTTMPHFKLVSNLQTYITYFNSSAVTNGCAINNGGCPFFCSPRSNGQRMCFCPDGYTIKDNNVDCVKTSGGDGHWFERLMASKVLQQELLPSSART